MTSLPLSKTLWQPHNQLNRSHTISLLRTFQWLPSLIKLKSKLLLYLMLPYVLCTLHVGCLSTSTELGMTFQVHLPPLLPFSASSPCSGHTSLLVVPHAHQCNPLGVFVLAPFSWNTLITTLFLQACFPFLSNTHHLIHLFAAFSAAEMEVLGSTVSLTDVLCTLAQNCSSAW